MNITKKIIQSTQYFTKKKRRKNYTLAIPEH